MNTFTVINTKVTIEGVTMDTYGIEKDTIRIEDISVNRNEVEEFVKKLNFTNLKNYEDILDYIDKEFFTVTIL
jgi:oligoribonuclease NrnB/cAMP/cGMP phosphodiesterase (DHH superfamily)